MSWLEQFKKIRELADKQEAAQRELIREERERERSIIDERRQNVKALVPPIETTCTQFCRAVQGKMTRYKSDEWGKLNFGWNLQADFGGIRVRTWPWLREASAPRQLRGVWLQHLSPQGSSTVAAKRARGTRLKKKESPTSSGYYCWPLSHDASRYTFGYFLPLEGFSDEELAKTLETIGHDLLKFHREDSPTTTTETTDS